MPKITFIEHDGTTHAVDGNIGSTVMELAVENQVSSIVAECGGGCTCGTCMVHVDQSWSKFVGAASQEEEEILDGNFEVGPNSRLACQIKITDEMDGLIVRTPAYQGR
jgi:2Fe-2S ferredoxin